MSANTFKTAAKTVANLRSLDKSDGYTASEARKEFTTGAEWGRVWTLRAKPSDAECIAILNAVSVPLGKPPQDREWEPAAIDRCREALLTAREEA